MQIMMRWHHGDHISVSLQHAALRKADCATLFKINLHFFQVYGKAIPSTTSVHRTKEIWTVALFLLVYAISRS